jgi:imidazolonepropionase-like amidohydrolase
MLVLRAGAVFDGEVRRAGADVLVEDGLVAADPAGGPRLFVSGPPLTTAGGHCWFLGGEVAGVEHARAVVAERADRGVDVIKVMATGGNLTRGSDMGAAQFPHGELTTLVAEIYRRGLPVAVHAHGGMAPPPRSMPARTRSSTSRS